MLAYLAERAGQTVSRADLLEHVWGYAASSKTRTVYAAMQRLRAKIEVEPSDPKVLITIGRSGYAFHAPAVAEIRSEGPTGWARPLDSFVGRRAEQIELTRWLQDAEGPLLLDMYGPSGTARRGVRQEETQCSVCFRQ